MSRGPKGERIPTSVQNHLGEGKLEKGRWDEMYIWAWDFAEECTGEDCPLYNICAYKKYWHMKDDGQGRAGYTKKCMMQQRYLKNVLHAVVETMRQKKEVSTENMIRMGYQMLPLYAQLFKFKTYEYKLGPADVVYESEKGAKKAHPVYKEIREIVKSIEGIWNKIGAGIKDKPKAGDIGDGSFVDVMFSAVEDEQEEEEQDYSEEGVGIDFDSVEEETKSKPKKKQSSKKRKRKA